MEKKIPFLVTPLPVTLLPVLLTKATKPYHHLSSTVQQPKEKPQECLIRFLDFKQKLLFASQKTESELNNDDPTLVNGMFVHSFSLGLRNKNIKIEMKPYLDRRRKL